MERLTERFGGRYIAIKGCSTAYKDMERKGTPAANAVVRLSAYEDTGLTPDEIITLKSIKSYADALEHELEKYMQAEKDGRLVVLPSRKDLLKCCPMRVDRNGNCGPIGGFCQPSTEICKALHAAYEYGVFNAREEAEAALKMREDDNEAD